MATVVVIEDEADLRDLIVEELQDQGHDVLASANGEQGLAAILKHKPRFVCCDINMPVMNGFAVKHKLNTLGIGPEQLTFIFITARSDKNDVADGLMIGADYYLTKPIDIERLIALCAQ